MSANRLSPARILLGLALLGPGLLAFALPGAATAQDGPEGPGGPTGRLAAVLQGLDKTTARVSTLEAPIDAVARFGTLEITARACEKKPPTEPPESAAFLQIVDVRPDSPAVELFSGWMFASSPAISALEHPVYDVWVVDCRRIAGPPAPDPGTPAGQAAAFPEAPREEAAPGVEAPPAGR